MIEHQYNRGLISYLNTAIILPSKIKLPTVQKIDPKPVVKPLTTVGGRRNDSLW